MEELGKHPFNYDLNRIGDYVEDLVSVGQAMQALEVIGIIKRKYLHGRHTGEINAHRMPFYHLQSYHNADFAQSMNGTRWEDGSIFSVIFELNKLERWIEGVKTKKGKEFTGEFVALFLYYNETDVNKENIDSIAREYGFKNGGKLIQHYNFFLKDVNRRADPESKTKLKNKIKLFETVKNEIDSSKRGKIEDELKILEGYLSKY